MSWLDCVITLVIVVVGSLVAAVVETWWKYHRS
ncbi:hypothetical protein ES703_76325 [subsurface metagenome]